MTRTITLTAVMLALVSIISAQDYSKSTRNVIRNDSSNPYQWNSDFINTSNPLHSNFFKEKDLGKRHPSKSSSSFNTRLDSILDGASDKSIYSYNSAGNCTLEAEFSLEVPNGWLNTTNRETIYNSANLVTDRILWSWDNTLMSVQPAYRESYAYQETGLISERIIYFWIENAWKPFSKGVFIYTDQEVLIESISYEWIENTQQYAVSGNSIYTYNATNGLIERIASLWSNNEWVPYIKQVHTLNEDNMPLSSIHYSWDLNLESWEPVIATDFLYNPSGFELERTISFWSTDSFVPDSKIEKVYDNLDRQISETNLFWSFTINCGYEALKRRDGNISLRCNFRYFDNLWQTFLFPGF